VLNLGILTLHQPYYKRIDIERRRLCTHAELQKVNHQTLFIKHVGAAGCTFNDNACVQQRGLVCFCSLPHLQIKRQQTLRPRQLRKHHLVQHAHSRKHNNVGCNNTHLLTFGHSSLTIFSTFNYMHSNIGATFESVPECLTEVFSENKFNLLNLQVYSIKP